MKLRYRARWSLLLILMCFGVAQQARSNDYTSELKLADEKVILEQFAEAREIYRKIIASSKDTIIAAYAHYKLGSLYRLQNEPAKARSEYEKGLVSLKKAGEANHQIGKYLRQALQVVG